MDSVELKLEDLTEVVGGQQQNVPGVPCPRCGVIIPTTIMQIISSSALVCPACGLRLNIDKTKSHDAIEALKKVEEAQKELERKKQY